MALLSITISNYINVFGGSRASLWGEMVWGEDNWGEGSRGLIKKVIKGFTEPITLTDTFSRSFLKGITNVCGMDSDVFFYSLYDPNGWGYVFHRPTINADQQYLPAWAYANNGPDVWSQLSQPINNWTYP